MRFSRLVQPAAGLLAGAFRADFASFFERFALQELKQPGKSMESQLCQSWYRTVPLHAGHKDCKGFFAPRV